MNPREPLDERVSDWLEGRLDPAEAKALEKELARQGRLEEARELARVVRLLGRAPLESPPPGLPDRVLQKIQGGAREPLPTLSRGRRALPWVLSLSAAAAAALLVYFTLPGAGNPPSQVPAVRVARIEEGVPSRGGGPVKRGEEGSSAGAELSSGKKAPGAPPPARVVAKKSLDALLDLEKGDKDGKGRGWDARGARREGRQGKGGKEKAGKAQRARSLGGAGRERNLPPGLAGKKEEKERDLSRAPGNLPGGWGRRGGRARKEALASHLEKAPSPRANRKAGKNFTPPPLASPEKPGKGAVVPRKSPGEPARFGKFALPREKGSSKDRDALGFQGKGRPREKGKGRLPRAGRPSPGAPLPGKTRAGRAGAPASRAARRPAGGLPARRILFLSGASLQQLGLEAFRKKGGRITARPYKLGTVPAGGKAWLLTLSGPKALVEKAVMKAASRAGKASSLLLPLPPPPPAGKGCLSVEILWLQEKKGP